MNRVAIDFREIDRCGECSEKWGICGYHQERFGVNWEGKSTMNDIPRRIDLQRNTPAELAIRAAVQAVEMAGCDPLLTDAVVLLDQAREKVAEYVDSKGIVRP